MEGASHIQRRKFKESLSIMIFPPKNKSQTATKITYHLLCYPAISLQVYTYFFLKKIRIKFHARRTNANSRIRKNQHFYIGISIESRSHVSSQPTSLLTQRVCSANKQEGEKNGSRRKNVLVSPPLNLRNLLKKNKAKRCVRGYVEFDVQANVW